MIVEEAQHAARAIPESVGVFTRLEVAVRAAEVHPHAATYILGMPRLGLAVLLHGKGLEAHVILVAEPVFVVSRKIAIDATLDALPFGAQIGQHLLDAVLVDDADALVRNPQANETLLGFDPESLVLQIRQEAPTRPVVGVGDIIAGLRPFPGHLAHFGHD
jgi:hypothetical protein